MSANSQPLLGLTPAELIGHTPAILLGQRRFEGLAAAINQQGFETDVPTITIGLPRCPSNERRPHMAIHCSSNFINGAHSLDLLDVSLSLHAPLARMERASNVDDLLSIVAQEIRTVSGFDRVMVYQFDDDWHGVVLAEEVADGNGATARGRIERYGHAAGGRPLTVVTTLPEPLS